VLWRLLGIFNRTVKSTSRFSSTMKNSNGHYIEATPLSFDQINQRFKLCCCHILNWAYGVGGLELVSAIVYLGRSIVALFQKGQLLSESIASIVEIVIGILWIGVIILFLLGVKKRERCFVIPHMVIQVLSLIGVAVVAILALVSGIIVVAGIMMISIVTNGYFFYVVIQTYRFLKANEEISNATVLVPIPPPEYSMPLVATDHEQMHTEDEPKRGYAE